MVEYSLRDFIDGRSILAGIVIVISLTGITFVAVPLILENNVSDNVSKGNWDMSSPTQAANTLNEHIDDLLFAEIKVSIVIDTFPDWGDDPIGHFYQSTSHIKLFRHLDSTIDGEVIDVDNPNWKAGTWQMDIEGESSARFIDSINGTLVNHDLQTSLAMDLEKLESLQNVTDSYRQEIDNSELVNDILYWEIDQVYDDGTLIHIKLFDQTIYIQRTTTKGLRVFGNSYGIVFDSAVLSPPSYMSETGANPLSNYENAINELLQNILVQN